MGSPMGVLRSWVSMYMLEQTHLSGGIYVADFVIIGANSVVTKSITDSGVIVAGCPARIIRKMTEKEVFELSNWNKK